MHRRDQINGGIFPDNPVDDRMSLFEHKALVSMEVTVETRVDLVRSDLKSVQRILTPVILAILSSKKNSCALQWIDVRRNNNLIGRFPILD